MTIGSLADSGADPGLAERFIEVICADDALVRAEFEALVAAEWAVSPPVRRVHARTADDHGVGRGRRRSEARSRGETTEPFPVSSDLVFARSPPATARTVAPPA